MGFFDFLKKEKRGREFTDEDRESSAEIRRLNGELRKAEKQQLIEAKRAEVAEMREELKAYKGGGYDDKEGGAEDYFLKLITPIIASKFGGAPQQQGEEQGEEIPEINLSDAEIDGIIKEYVPKKLKFLAKILSEENCKAAIMRLDEHGLLNDANIDKIVKKLKGTKE